MKGPEHTSPGPVAALGWLKTLRCEADFLTDAQNSLLAADLLKLPVETLERPHDVVQLRVDHLKLLRQVLSSWVFFQFQMLGRAHSREGLLEVLPRFHLVVRVPDDDQICKGHLVDQPRDVPEGKEGGLLPLGDLSLVETLELCSCRDDGDELANDLVHLWQKDRR